MLLVTKLTFGQKGSRTAPYTASQNTEGWVPREIEKGVGGGGGGEKGEKKRGGERETPTQKTQNHTHTFL